LSYKLSLAPNPASPRSPSRRPKGIKPPSARGTAGPWHGAGPTPPLSFPRDPLLFLVINSISEPGEGSFGVVFIYLFITVGLGIPSHFFFFLVIGVETKFITIECLIKNTLKRKAAAIILAG